MLVAAILCVHCAPVPPFEHLLQPLTILGAIPLSIGGALTAPLLAGSALGAPARSVW